MSSPAAERTRAPAGADLEARLRAYYTRYYRDALGIPGWRGIVDVRAADRAYEGQRLARLERAVGLLVAGRRLLEVGCGTGGFHLAARGAGADAWGVDASAEAVALAAARAGAGRLLEAAAEALPFPDRSFDLVYCYSTLEHVADAAGAVRELVRVLRPGGRLYLHTPHRWAWFEGHYKVLWVPGLPRPLGRAYLALRGRPTAFLDGLRPLTLGECRALLGAAGARVVRVLDDDADRRVGGPLWPLVRLYYRVTGVRPYVELVAARGEDAR